MTTNTQTTPAAATPAERLLIEADCKRLERFAHDNAKNAPAALRAPHSISAFRALPVAARRAVIRANVTSQILSGVGRPGGTPAPAKRQPPRDDGVNHERPSRATLPPRETTPKTVISAPAPALAVGAYWVPCAGACGQMIPARSAFRAVVRYCATDGRTARKKRDDAAKRAAHAAKKAHVEASQ